MATDKQAGWLSSLKSFLGSGTTPDPESIRDLTVAFDLAALEERENDPEFAYVVGCLFYQGTHVVRSPEIAKRWWEKASDKGHTVAAHNLACLLGRGEGCGRDLPRAVELWRKAAGAGYAPSQTCLGFRLHFGQGITKDSSEARTWWEKAARQNDGLAIHMLGSLASQGVGENQDQHKAILLWQQASGLGVAEAMTALGKAALLGNGLPQEIDTAERHFREAAEKGDSEAQLQLGKLYLSKDHGRENVTQAIACLKSASNSGLAEASELLKTIPAELRTDEPLYVLGSWLKKTTEKSASQAQNLFGTIVEKGREAYKNMAGGSSGTGPAILPSKASGDPDLLGAEGSTVGQGADAAGNASATPVDEAGQLVDAGMTLMNQAQELFEKAVDSDASKMDEKLTRSSEMFEEAARLLQRAYDIYQEADLPTGSFDISMVLADALISSNQEEKAVPIIAEAFRLGEQLEEKMDFRDFQGRINFLISKAAMIEDRLDEKTKARLQYFWKRY